jgi:hypothetical protein
MLNEFSRLPVQGIAQVFRESFDDRGAPALTGLATQDAPSQ